MKWVIDAGHRYVISPGGRMKDHCRTAIQLNSLDTPESVVFTHTGFREIDSQILYLTGNGAVFASGWKSDVHVKLHGGMDYSLTLPKDKSELQESIKVSLDMLKVANVDVSLPLLCSIYRAPLGDCNYSLFLVGKTGCGKSTLAALAQQHYGKKMTAERLPANWASTGNALEVLAFSAKDSILVVDDFASTQKYSRTAERLLRAAGNSSGRLRLNRDSALKAARPPRSLIISTGEDLPQISSILARCQIIEVANNMINWDEVTKSQKAAATGLFEIALGGYIQWLLPKYKGITDVLGSRIHEIRLDFNSRGFDHKRTGTIAAEQYIGLKLFLRYALEKETISKAEHDRFLAEGFEVLGRIGDMQVKTQRENNPCQQFIEAISSAISSGKAHLSSTNNEAPDDANICGWRFVNQNQFGGEWRPQGSCIGWVDENKSVMLDPISAYRSAQEMLSGQLDITKSRLWKSLAGEGLIIPDQRRETNLIRRRIGGVNKNVLLMGPNILQGNDSLNEINLEVSDDYEIPE